MRRIPQLFNLSLIDKSSLRLAQAAVVALIAMMVLITVEVIIRPFGVSTLIAHEFTGYLLVALVFLGLAEVLRMGKHIRVTVLSDRLKPKVKSLLYKANLAVGTVFVLALFWATAKYVYSCYVSVTTTPSLVRVLVFIPQLPMPIGLFVFVLLLAAQIFREFRGAKSLK